MILGEIKRQKIGEKMYSEVSFKLRIETKITEEIKDYMWGVPVEEIWESVGEFVNSIRFIIDYEIREST